MFLLPRKNKIIFARNIFNCNLKVCVKEICQLSDQERSTRMYALFVLDNCVNMQQVCKILVTSQYFLSSSGNRTELWDTRIVWKITITVYLNNKEENVTEINHTA